MESPYKLPEEEIGLSKNEQLFDSNETSESDLLFGLLQSANDQVDFSCLPTIIELIQQGASIKLLYDSDLIHFLSNIAFKIFTQTKNEVGFDRTIAQIGDQFDGLFQLFILIGLLSDDDLSYKFVEKFKIQDFLKDIAQSTKEPHVLQLCIQCNYNFIYNKPKTSNLFDYGFFILHFYSFYNKVTNRSENQVSQLPFEALNLIMAYLINHPQWFIDDDGKDDQVSRIYYSFITILTGTYSRKDSQEYFNQITLILTKLVEILTTLPSEITRYFYTARLINEFTSLLSFNPEIDMLILKCLDHFSMSFEMVYLLLQKQPFMNYEAPSLPHYKIYLKVLVNCVFSILTETRKERKIKRPSDAQLFIKNNIPRLVSLSNMMCENQDFELRQLSSLLIISMANFTNNSFLSDLLANDGKIMEKIISMLEERNIEYAIYVARSIYNIMNFCTTVGEEANSILSLFLQNKEDIEIALQEMEHEIPKNEVNIKDEFQSVIELIGKLFESFE